jgi:hypothetical protein
MEQVSIIGLDLAKRSFQAHSALLTVALVSAKSFLIRHYPQPSRHGTKLEHTAVSAGLSGRHLQH